MTREEALQILDTIPTIGEQVDALEMAIQALSQEPCDDAVSRDAPRYWIDKDSKLYKMPDDIPTMTIQYPTITHEDTISRTEVMRVISDFVTLEKYIDKHNHITFEPLEKMINELPSVTQKSGWIPVSKRLPKERQRVLVTQILGERTVVYGTTFPFEKIKEKYITAWMPLPTPYEPQESEDKE